MADIIRETDEYVRYDIDFDEIVDAAQQVEAAAEGYDDLNDRLDDMDDSIAQAQQGIHFKGFINYYSDLPSSPMENDAYTVLYSGTSGTEPDGTEYVWSNHGGTYEWNPWGKSTYSQSQIDTLLSGKANTSHTQASSTINAMTGYSMPSSTSAIAETDTLNAAVGKLEKGVDVNKTNILLSEQMNGAKNIFRTNPTSTPPTGITVNSDGTVTINDTFSTATEFALGGLTGTYSGYTLLGCTGGADNTYKLMYQYRISGGNVQVLKQFDAPVDFNLSNITWSTLTIRIEAGQTVNTVIKPMICKKDFITGGMSDYQPYAMSNAEITAWILAHS